MATRVNKPVSVTLGPLAARAEARVKSGDYSSISEVVREGIRALDREDAFVEAMLKKRLAQLDDNPEEDIPIEKAAAHMRAYSAAYRAKHDV